MRIEWRRRFFILGILLVSIFVPTRQQQREIIKSKWDNRLLPTNSVYAQSQKLASGSGKVPSSGLSNENNFMDNSRGIENSSSRESENSEEIYDEDYELEDVNEEEKMISKISTSQNSSQENGEKDEKFGLENSSTNQDNDYYYYDDYENVTTDKNGAAERHLVDYFDASEDLASQEKHEESLKTSEEKNSKITSSLFKNSSGEENATQIPLSINNESREIPDDDRIEEKLSKNYNVEKMEEKSPKNPDDEKIEEKSPKNPDDEFLIGEAVVSVVTTKSVVNGTISIPSTELPMTTEQILSPLIPSSTANPHEAFSPEIEDSTETTEDSRIVASVQTSRSISGARFLPFLVVENIDNKNSENSSEKNVQSEVNEKIDEKFEVSQSTTKKTSIPSESTESIIDKLDRVQSELSSGFLANGFRTSGNNLQLDVLSEQRPTQARKSFTTTSRTPIISKFVPRRFNAEKKMSTTTQKIMETLRDDDTTGSTEKIKFRWPSSSRNSRPSTTETNFTPKNKNINNENRNHEFPSSPRTPSPISGSTIQDISAFLPPGYKLKKEDSAVTEKSILSEILAKSKIDISDLLPASYNVKVTTDSSPEVRKEEGKIVEKNLENMFEKSQVDFSSLLPAGFQGSEKKISEDGKISSTTEKSEKPGKNLDNLFAKASVDISALLPPGYNRFKNLDTLKTEKSTVEMTSEASTIQITVGTTPKSSGGIKLVFPSRPGGRKASAKSTTTAHSSRVEGSGAVTPRIQRGWPTRATTEFTGWPTPSTTPISIEKLLEAARTATVASTNVSVIPMTETSPTTSTTTTTTTTQRPTTPGICEDECEVAGTIRIVGNATWVPELLDRNTQEWQQLAEEIEKEMNLVFIKSSVLRKWYKRIRIDAFSPGSILVDYFIELIDISQRINTQELKVIFHDSLRTYNSDKWNETRAKGPIRLGAFSLDPKSTDFVVIPKVSYPQHIETDNRLIPQWAIAVIVIGVGGLLFIIVFGVSVLVNRQNASKLKPGPVVYTEEVAKNMIQASHGAPSHRSSQDYPKSDISTIWNDTEVWRDKSFESNSNEVLVDGTLGRERNPERRNDERKYNMYDSWRSEWNGYYYNPSQSSKFAGYESTTNLSRHPPDYDTNF